MHAVEYIQLLLGLSRLLIMIKGRGDGLLG